MKKKKKKKKKKISFEKMKKASGDVILHFCTKKHSHVMYAYSDMECNRHNFCHFRPFFFPIIDPKN